MSDNTILPQGQPVLRVVPMPADANSHGDIFGGWIMSHVDIAGSIQASRPGTLRHDGHTCGENADEPAAADRIYVAPVYSESALKPEGIQSNKALAQPRIRRRHD